MKIYFWEQWKSLWWHILLIPLMAGLGYALYVYEKYTAVVFLVVFGIVIALDVCHFIVIREDTIGEFAWGKIKIRIKAEDIYSIETNAGNPESISVLGTKDIIRLPYRKKTFKAIISMLDISDEDVSGFLEESWDAKIESGVWTLYRDNVLLDQLFAKKKYIRRRVVRDE